MELIIQLIAGAVGGNATGAAAKNLSLGTLGNTIAGLIGGLGGGALLGGAAAADTATGGGFDIMGLLGGAGGGAILTAIVGLVKNAMAK